MHEAGHPLFKDDPNIIDKHIPGTIMQVFSSPSESPVSGTLRLRGTHFPNSSLQRYFKNWGPIFPFFPPPDKYEPDPGIVKTPTVLP
jgi:hypothetical protein